MKLNTLLFLSPLVLLAGCCSPYHRWLSDIFDQGIKVDQETAVVRQYFRAAHVYDQFSTVGHFDVIWRSDEVRREYAKMRAIKFCYRDEEYCTFLQQQLDENKHTISFYVLTALPSCYNSMLYDPDPEWVSCLLVDNQLYRPKKITLIDLEPEYLKYFGKAYTNFKTAYEIQFNAQDTLGNPLITPQTEKIELMFSRPDRKVILTWCLDEQGQVIRQRLSKIYDTLQYDLQCCP